MANEIKIDLSLTGEQATARGLDNVGDKAEHAGDNFQKMARDAGFLDKRVGELRGELRGLFAEFDRTGDKDILKKIRIDQRELGQLDRLKKQMSGLFDDGDKGGIGIQLGKTLAGAGAGAGAKFGEELTGSLRALKGPAIVALVGVAAAATPFLSAAISSAIIGGVGLGGIVGGIALAAQDARVQDAGKALGEHALSAFQKSAEPFLKPVIAAIGVLDSVVDDVAGSLQEAFRGVAPALVPLTKGLTGLVQEMMPGLVQAMNNARPLLLTIGMELPKIGKAIGYFFEIISRDPRGAIMAFQDLSRIIQVTLILTGRFLMAMSTIWNKISPFIQAATGHMDVAAVKIGEAGLAMEEANRLGGELAGGLEDLAGSATEAQLKMTALNDALTDFLDIALSTARANIAYERTWDELVKGITKGRDALREETEQGRKNQELIFAHIDAIRARHQARMDEGMTLEQSLPIMDAEIERLRKELLALGLNKQEANELINLYAKWPTKAVTVIEAQGLEATTEGIRELISLFRTANAMTIGGIAGATVKVGGKRAAGGPVMAGQTYLIGERGPELLTMGSTNGNVTSATQTAAMMSGASGGSWGGTQTIRFVIDVNSSGDDFDALIARKIRAQVAEIGGGNVQNTYGEERA